MLLHYYSPLNKESGMHHLLSFCFSYGVLIENNMLRLLYHHSRLVAGMKNAAIVDQFYDKSNWCIVLEKL